MFQLCMNNCVSKFNFNFINNVFEKKMQVSNLKFEFFSFKCEIFLLLKGAGFFNFAFFEEGYWD